MNFPLVEIRCDEEKRRHEEISDIFRKHDMPAPIPRLIVTLHGKKAELLGEYAGNGFHYCAVRPVGYDRFRYETIKPHYVRY